MKKIQRVRLSLCFALILLGSSASAQSLPFTGTTTSSNVNLSAFDVTNNTNTLGSTNSFRAFGSNPSGRYDAIYARGDIGINSGTTAVNNGYGIYTGCSATGSNYCYGLYALVPAGAGANSTAAYFSSVASAVVAFVPNTAAGVAIQTTADNISAKALKTTSVNGTALEASSTNGTAATIYSNSSSQSALYARQDNYQPAVSAVNFSFTTGGDAVFASSTKGNGVQARCTSSSCGNGVWGYTANPNASCVIGQSDATVQGFGVVGRSFGNGKAIFGDLVNGTGGYAGFFNGNVHVGGILSKALGTFRIDHPQDPANKFLVHSFVESPDIKNIYDGIVALDANGEATVTLPNYFEALNESFRYQLTPVGGQATLYVKSELSAGKFVIAGGRLGLKASWQITGIRKDPVAKAHPIEVEEAKPIEQRGRYLNPELYGPKALPLFDPPSQTLPTQPSGISAIAPPVPDMSSRPSPPAPN